MRPENANDELNNFLRQAMNGNKMEVEQDDSNKNHNELVNELKELKEQFKRQQLKEDERKQHDSDIMRHKLNAKKEIIKKIILKNRGDIMGNKLVNDFNKYSDTLVKEPNPLTETLLEVIESTASGYSDLEQKQTTNAKQVEENYQRSVKYATELKEARETIAKLQSQVPKYHKEDVQMITSNASNKSKIAKEPQKNYSSDAITKSFQQAYSTNTLNQTGQNMSNFFCRYISKTSC